MHKQELRKQVLAIRDFIEALPGVQAKMDEILCALASAESDIGGQIQWRRRPDIDAFVKLVAALYSDKEWLSCLVRLTDAEVVWAFYDRSVALESHLMESDTEAIIQDDGNLVTYAFITLYHEIEL